MRRAKGVFGKSRGGRGRHACIRIPKLDRLPSFNRLESASTSIQYHHHFVNGRASHTIPHSNTERPSIFPSLGCTPTPPPPSTPCLGVPMQKRATTDADSRRQRANNRATYLQQAKGDQRLTAVACPAHPHHVGPTSNRWTRWYVERLVKQPKRQCPRNHVASRTSIWGREGGVEERRRLDPTHRQRLARVWSVPSPRTFFFLLPVHGGRHPTRPYPYGTVQPQVLACRTKVVEPQTSGGKDVGLTLSEVIGQNHFLR